MSNDPKAIQTLTAEDRLEIAEIFASWATFEDSGNAEGWASLFTRDGGYTSGKGKKAHGYEQLVQKSRERWSKPESRLAVHWFGDPIITATDEGAEASHYGILIDKTAEGGYQMRDPSIRTYTLRREDGRWKIANRTITRLPAEA